MTAVRTDRLLLERLTIDEARAVVALDRAGRAWVSDYPTEGDLVVAGIVCEAGGHHDEVGFFGVYQVRLTTTGEAVGGIGFLHPPEGGAAEVGYGLAESVRGCGYATEALRALLDLAGDEGAEVVVAMTAVDNVASQRVLERCGFERGELLHGDEDGPMIAWARRLRTDSREREQAGSA